MLTCTLIQFHNSYQPDQSDDSHEFACARLRATAIGIDVTLRDKVHLLIAEVTVLLLELVQGYGVVV